MAGKKKVEEEVAKDFFGDDADWFVDEDAGGAAGAAARVPAASGPPPAAPPPPAPRGATPAATAPRAGAPTEEAPTLMFMLDQLPELPAPQPESTAETMTSFPAITSLPPLPSPAAPPRAEAVPAPDVAAVDTPRTRRRGPSAATILPPDEPAVEPVVESTGEPPSTIDKTEDLAGEMVDPGPPVPMVLTSTTPAPPRADGARSAPRPLEKFVPTTEVDDWRAAASILEVEADAGTTGRAGLLGHAGRLIANRVGDTDAAARFLREAIDAGSSDPHVLAALQAIAAATGNLEEALRCAESAAGRAEGTAAADAWLEAAEIARGLRADAAIAAVKRAVAADGLHYRAAWLERELLTASERRGPDLAAALRRVADLSDGSVAAEALADLAGLEAETGNLGDSLATWRRAWETAPSYGPARAGLEAALRWTGDLAGLAALYEAEAERGGSDGAWWSLEAARAHTAAGNREAAAACWQRAAEHDPSALREWEATAAHAGDETGRIAALEAQTGAGTASERAAAGWRLGRVHEQAGRRAEAIEAWRAALSADPTASPAADGIARLLRSGGDLAELRGAWKARAEAGAGNARRVAAVVEAELAEAMGDLDGALEAFRTATSEPDVTGWVAVDGQARVARAMGDGSAAADAEQRRAGWSSDPQRAADYRWAALTAPTSTEPGPEARAAGGAAVRAILASDPGHPGALDWCTALGGHDAMTALEAAAVGESDPSRKASLLYRAARVGISAGEVAEAARISGEAAAGVGADPLVAVLQNDTGHRRDERLRSRASGEGADAAERAWAAIALDDDAVLSELADGAGDGSGVVATLEVARLAGDPAGRIELFARRASGTAGAASAWAAVRLAKVHEAAGRTEEAVRALVALDGLAGVERPLGAAAAMAESLGQPELAVKLLEGRDDPASRFEVARLVERSEPDRAFALYRDELARHPEGRPRLDAALGLARTARLIGAHGACIDGHSAVAELASPAPMRAAHAAWAARLLEDEGRIVDALHSAGSALAARPGSREAFETVIRLQVATRDGAGIRATSERYRSDDVAGAVDALAKVGDDGAQIELLRGATGSGDRVAVLPLQLRLELLLARSGDWQAAYDALSRRRELCESESTREAIDARRRWILAEKLAESDTAWELYRQLHQDAPADRDVTEALARIAGLRGETSLAIQFLRELADGTTDPGESARLQRRIGEASEQAGDRATARRAYLDALDHVRDDASAIGGLKRLAEADGDWHAMVGVLQREAALATGDRRVEILREIARVTEANTPIEGKAGEVALDGWRAVLDVQPGDPEALARMYDIAENVGNWATMVEMGTARAASLAGTERADLLRRLGEVAVGHLDVADGMRFYEEAAANEPPDAVSAARLEPLHAERGDAAGVARAQRVQAEHAAEVDDRVAAWVRLARGDLDRRDRESAAEHYLQAFALRSDTDPALRFLVGFLIESGRYAEALPVYEAFEEVVEEGQDLDDPDVRLELATFWFNFGELLRNASRSADSIPRYERSLDLNPSHLLALEAVGALYIGAGAWKKAERAYRQVLQVTGGQGERTKVANAYAHLGLIERALGSREKAEKRFAKALEVFPNHVPALKGMALMAADKEDWSNLLNIYNNVIYHATAPQDVIDAYMIKGHVLDQYMGRADKAAQHYQRSLDFDPNQPAALLRLSELALRQSEFAQAAELANRGLALDTTPDLSRLRGALLAASAAAMRGLGQPESAGRADEARAADPRFSGFDPSDLEQVRAAIQAALAT